MLQSVATRLKACLRESDTISRQGGDEFLLILSGVQEADIIASIAKKVLTELEKSFEIDSNTLSLSGSIGIALYPDHGETFETLLQSADTAMYKAKETGKNRYHFYTQQMSHNLIGQFKIQSDLKSALANNEFILYYQPQIDLATNSIIGVEALIRWNHPQLGMMPQMNFIPIAESSGLIVSIGQWVIEEACRQVALWQEMGIELCIAVNISAMQFKRGNLEEIVINALSTSKINPKYLELELTESIIMHDADNTLQSVRNLKELGVQLSIDDFGTGYSSLSYLKRFAVDKLKIDQSFVRDILQDKDDAAIVKTIIQMAKNLNLITIAEGVENQEVLSNIQKFGCDEVQGYHFAKPMSAYDFELYHTNFYGKKS
jgi:predicted signal transduction protein with EAL and GGDEF domain